MDKERALERLRALMEEEDEKLFAAETTLVARQSEVKSLTAEVEAKRALIQDYQARIADLESGRDRMAPIVQDYREYSGRSIISAVRLYLNKHQGGPVKIREEMLPVLEAAGVLSHVEDPNQHWRMLRMTIRKNERTTGLIMPDDESIDTVEWPEWAGYQDFRVRKLPT